MGRGGGGRPFYANSPGSTGLILLHFTARTALAREQQCEAQEPEAQAAVDASTQFARAAGGTNDQGPGSSIAFSAATVAGIHTIRGAVGGGVSAAIREVDAKVCTEVYSLVCTKIDALVHTDVRRKVRG